MKQLSRDAEIVCADYSFTSLYLGKRFLLPDAQCVCLDGEYPLPFVGGYFNCVFSTDALQYIQPKVGLAREFRRVMSDDGIIALAHLHNRLSPDKGPGQTLTPSGYLGLFDSMVRRLYPEETLVADYVADGALNLDRACALTDLNQALGGVSLVAANTDSVFRSHTGILDTNIDAIRHPNVNPVYRARRSDGTWVLERSIGAPYAVARTIQDREVLPSRGRSRRSRWTAQGSSRCVRPTGVNRMARPAIPHSELPESYASGHSAHADLFGNIVDVAGGPPSGADHARGNRQIPRSMPSNTSVRRSPRSGATLTDLEVVLIDDGSTDGTIRGPNAQFDRFEIIRQAGRPVCRPQWIRGAAAATALF